MKTLLFCCALFLSFVSIAQNSKKEEKAQNKAAQYQQVMELLNSGGFEFIAQRANPQRGPQIDLTNRSNYLRIERNNASAEMPFFGRAYSGGYSSSDGGIRFNNAMENFQVTENKKKTSISVKFRVKGEGDTFNCTLIASSLENASLSVLSTNKQAISYTGSISALSEKK